jgi:pimeloyl-ACP methyl ester carboxylesterase
MAQLVPLPGGQQLQLFDQGSGEPLFFLHGYGLQLGWNDALERLSRSRRVIAPLFAGFGESSGVEEINDVLDAVVYLNDVLDALGLECTDVAGFDLGGMLAAELAAVTPNRVKRLVLIAPFGLWDERHETLDVFATPPPVLRGKLFADSESKAANDYFTLPEEPAALLERTVQRTRALSASTRFLWPIPERGLVRRLHRIRAETLIVWGRGDQVIAPSYADLFKDKVPNASVALLDGAHMLPLEEPEALAARIAAFLA